MSCTVQAGSISKSEFLSTSGLLLSASKKWTALNCATGSIIISLSVAQLRRFDDLNWRAAFLAPAAGHGALPSDILTRGVMKGETCCMQPAPTPCYPSSWEPRSSPFYPVITHHHLCGASDSAFVEFMSLSVRTLYKLLRLGLSYVTLL